MYLAHYGLTETPFSITPDPRFVFLSDRHRDALAHLIYGISQGGGGGFVQLTGEVGTGKTTLSRLLLEQLPPNTRVALVLNPRLDPNELLEAICQELGLDVSQARGSGKALVDTLNRYLLEAHAQHLKIVLILDEAQQLSVPALEQVRLLTNLETATDKLLQIVLLGQPELRELLQRPDLRQLSQRITARYHLTPLDAAETADYVRHRLAVAGLNRSPFTERALTALHTRSGGVPRLVNVIAERALLAGYARDLTRLDARVVNAAADELLPRPARAWLRRMPAIAAAISGIALLAALALWAPWQDIVSPSAVAMVEAESDEPPTAPALATLLEAVNGTADSENALLAVWQGDSRMSARLADCPFQFDGGSLYCIRTRGTLAQLAALDRPVLLIVPRADAVRAVALLGLDGDNAIIQAGNVPTTIVQPALGVEWPGEYLALFRLPEPVSPVRNTPLPEWARAALSRFESNRSLPPLSEDAGRVRRLQQAHGLRADAIIGPETWWVLSAYVDGGPRLASPMPAHRSR